MHPAFIKNFCCIHSMHIIILFLILGAASKWGYSEIQRELQVWHLDSYLIVSAGDL